MILGKGPSETLFLKTLRSINFQKVPAANIFNRWQIGNRDWVAFGKSGAAIYYDEVAFPFPPIRFKENSNELLALREKEKGDWRKLTLDEKKILYRASFRQTFSEMNAPTGQWKSLAGSILFFVSVGIWLFIITQLFAQPPLPPSFSEEHRRKTLRFLLVNKHGHLSGVSSKWDYELDDWKK